MKHLFSHQVLRLGRQLLGPALLATTALTGQAQTLSGPAGISSGIRTWLDASDVNADGLPNNPADGVAITTWADKSGRNQPGQQLAGYGAATLASDAGSTLNGLPVMRFASGKVYNFSGIDIRAAAMEDLTIITVYRQGNAGSTGLWGNDNGNWDRFMYTAFGGPNGIASRGPGQSPPNTTITGSGVPGRTYLFTAVYDGAVSGSANNGPVNGSAFYFNGALLGNFTDRTDPSAAQTTLRLGFDGDDGFFVGDVAEFIVYDRVLGQCEIQAINTYLSRKYGITFSVAAVTASGSTALCAGGSVTLTANPAATYQWQRDGQDLPGATSAAYVATQPGSYTVTVPLNGCGTATSAPTVVTVNPQPTLSYAATDAGCAGTPGSLTVTPLTGTAPFTYSLNGGAYGSSPTFGNLAAGTYQLRVRDAKGCESVPVAATVRGGTSAPVAVAQNVTVQLDAQGNATVTADQVNNGSTAGCGPPTLTVAPGTFTCANVGPNTVTLTVTDAAGRTASATATVTVQDNTAPVAVVRNITLPLNAQGVATLTPADLDGGSTDNCGITNRAVSNTSFGCNSANYALGFDGTNDYLNLPNGIVQGLKDFTFETWVNYQDNGAWTRIMDFGTGTTVNMFLTPKANNGLPRLAITVGGIGGEQRIDGSGTMPTGWHHIAVVLDHDPATDKVVGKMYIDGTVVGQNNNMTLTPSNLGITTQNLMGKSQYADPYLKGKMDEVRIWSVARTQAEIQTYLNKSLSGQEYGLFVYYDFEDGPNSATVRDKSSSRNHGTLVNMNTATAFSAPGVIQSLGIGTHPITLTVSDAAGRASSATAQVTVVDNIAPTLTTRNLTLALGANGTVTANERDLAVTYADNCAVATLTVAPRTFTCQSLGANPVLVTVTDVSGNQTSVPATITIEDTTAPTAVAQNVTVQLDASGSATVTAAQVNNNSADNCGIASLSLDKTTFTCANVGPNPVTLTVTDNSGKVSRATATVTVRDNLAPTLACQPATVLLDANGQASISPADVVTTSADNCAVTSLTVSPSTFGAANVGPNAVTVTARDAAGLVSTCQTTVTVVEPAPVAVCQPATVQLDANGQATLTAAQVDGGSHSLVGLSGMTVSPSTFTCANVGPNTVTLTVTNRFGRSATCQAVVTVEDVAAPVAVAQNVTVYLDAQGNASVTEAQVDNGSADNCAVASLTVAPSAFSCANVGPNPVTLTVTDVSGNVSTTSATVTVVDGAAPVAVAQNVTVQLDANGQASVTAADVNNGSTDNCGIRSLTVEPSSFNCTNVGPNAVTLRVTDVNGNVSMASATVTVADGTAPTVVAQNLTILLNANGQAGITAAQVDNGSADNCGIRSLTVEPNSFSCASVGPNTVTLTAFDVAGNYSTATATVTVVDGAAPVARAQNVTVYLDAQGNATVTAAQVDNGSTDNCGIRSLTVTPSAFSCASVGANPVTLTALDAAGNRGTATATVTVIDRTAPVARAQNVTVQLDANGRATLAAADVNNGSTDNCNVTLSVSPSTFSCANLGPNAVTLRVADPSGNVSTATAVATVVDRLAPVVRTRPVTVYLNAAGQASVTAAQVNDGSTDNCGGIASVVLSKTSFGCANLGANALTLSVTDAYGNVGTAPAVVTVADNLAPVLNNLPCTQYALAWFNNCSAVVCWSAPRATDNCSAVITSSHASGSAFPVGTTRVTITATDPAGNTDVHTFDVIVLGQPMYATISSPVFGSGGRCDDDDRYNVSCYGSSNGSATVCVAGGCQPYRYRWSNGQTTATATNLAAGTYSVTITDGNGAQVVRSITLTQPSPVVARIVAGTACNGAPAGTIYRGYGSQSLVLCAGASGGAGGFDYTWAAGPGMSRRTGSTIVVMPTATTTYTVTAVDDNGCASTATITVTVRDVRCGTRLDRVTMCRNGQEICVGAGAVAAYQYIGYTIGSCNRPALRTAPAVASDATTAPAAVSASASTPASAPAGTSPEAATPTAASAPTATPLARLTVEAFPNPNVGTFSLRIRAAEEGQTTADLYDLQGRRVQTLFADRLLAGEQREVRVESLDLSSAVYLVRVQNGTQTELLRVTVVH